MDDTALSNIFNAATGVWALVAMVFVALFRVWPLIMDKLNEQRRDGAAEKAADWTRLRDEVNRLSEAEKQCRRDYAELHRQHMDVIERLTSLEGYMAGQGKASQEAAGVIALERVERNHKKSDNSGE